MYKQLINNKINLKDFFDVYPSLVKVYSEESNKYIKLFEEPRKRRVNIKNLKRNDKFNKSFHSEKSLNSVKESMNETLKNVSEKSNFSYKHSNSLERKNTKDLEQIKENDNKKYFLINKGLELQNKKMKRTHSIKRSLQTFLYNTSVIEKLNENLCTIEKKLNSTNNIMNKSNKNIEEKIQNKIHVIVEKLSNQLKIEKIPENKFIIKMNDIGDKCYFLLSGKLSIMKPVEYKNIPLTAKDYIHYLVSLMKYDEIFLIEKVIDMNHIHIDIETINNLKIITKGYFLRKIDNYLETFKTVTKEDFENILDEYNLKFEDFKLNTKETIKDIEDINNNNYIDSNDSIDSEDEKNITQTKSKYALLKAYMNKFKMSVEEKVKLVNFNYLFNPKEEKKIYNFTLYKYEFFLNLFPGSFFGDMALEAKAKKRNATIRTEEECFILSLDNNDYISLLYEDNKKLKSMDLIFLTSKFFFREISPVLFEKYYFAKFKFFEKNKGDIIYKQDDEFSSLYFIKKGDYKLETKASVIDLHNLIKFFIDILAEKNYLKYSNKYIENLKDTYLCDPELLELKSKNVLYKEKFNEKHKLEISTINKHEILGDLELFLTSGYINTCTIISQKAEYFEIKKRDLCDIFIEQKEVLPDYYSFVMNKLISQIKRFYFLKNNLISQIKSKIDSHFYQPLISPNFFEQIEKSNTNNYYRDKFNLKKNMPKVFKYSHFSPPVIYDSKWKPKLFEQEKNEVYNHQQKEIEKKENENDKLDYSFNKNNNKSDIINNNMINNNINRFTEINNNENNIKIKVKKNVLKNQHICKIMEEVSTSKSLNSSILKFNYNIKNRNKNNRNNKFTSLGQFTYNTNQETIIAGKYHLSIRKLKKEIKSVDNHDPLNLNIVKKYSIDKSIISSLINNNNNNNNNHLSSSSTNSFLPPIKIYKQKILVYPYKIKKNLSMILNKPKSLKNELENLEFKRKENLEISQAVKNFYMKQRQMGYASIVNKNNNCYYKLGKGSFFK